MENNYNFKKGEKIYEIMEKKITKISKELLNQPYKFSRKVFQQKPQKFRSFTLAKRAKSLRKHGKGSQNMQRLMI